MIEKPTVYYCRPELAPLTRVPIAGRGMSAIVFPINHQSDLVSNTKYAITSYVVARDPDFVNNGKFETENTIYSYPVEAQ